MTYYSESGSRQLRGEFEEVVLQWPDVKRKKMFGAPTYVTGGTIFAILMDAGIVLTRLDEEKRKALLADPGAEVFVARGRVMKTWVLIRIRDLTAIARYLPFIKESYLAAGGGTHDEG